MNKNPYHIGRPRIYATPEDLLKAANKYLEYVHENPLYENRLMVTSRGGDMGSEVGNHELAKARVMSVGGFCVHASIAESTFYDYQTKPEFSEVIKRLSAIFANQQLEGASSGFFNPNIIAQKLGLNKQEIQNAQSITIKTANGEKLNDLLSKDD